jgi:hypothetical protein
VHTAVKTSGGEGRGVLDFFGKYVLLRELIGVVIKYTRAIYVFIAFL